MPGSPSGLAVDCRSSHGSSNLSPGSNAFLYAFQTIDIGDVMSERSVTNTYNAMFGLIDIQELWRKTRPAHALSDTEKGELVALLQSVRKSLDAIEEEVL